MADVLVGDDLDLRPENGVAVGVVKVEVSVDHPADGFVGDQLQVLQEGSRSSGSCPGVHEEDVAIPDKDGVIAASRHRACGSRVVDAVRDLLEAINLARDNGSA